MPLPPTGGHAVSQIQQELNAAGKPTPKNCPGDAGFMKTTGAAALEERSVFAFATRKLAGTGQRRCTARP